MVNKSSVRDSNKEYFKECIRLRKQGLSYSEIQKIIPVAKSTLQNWLVLAGLTLTQEHLEIQLQKRLEKRQAAIEASKITRSRRLDNELQKFSQEFKIFLNDPFFVGGIMLYEAEGSKNNSCVLSNSDYRVIIMFVRFLERYFSLDRVKNMHFRVYIHEIRSNDLEKIKGFWAKKLHIPIESIALSWKKNIVTHRRNNPDYVGQLTVSVSSVSFLTRKLLFMSSIILKKYCGVV